MPRPTLKTEFCDRVGIEYPVVLAGLGPVAGTGAPVATVELVAAVSNAGGLGVIGGVAYPPEELRKEIKKVRSLTDKPFGVDLLLSSNFPVFATLNSSASGFSRYLLTPCIALSMKCTLIFFTALSHFLLAQ